jgi:hypothetical protein
MPQCIHFITREVQCTLDAGENERCAKHHAQHLKREADAGAIREGGCHAILVNGKRCDRFANGESTLCTRHIQYDARAKEIRERQRLEDISIEQRSAVFINDGIAWRLCLQMLLSEWRESLISGRVFWQVAKKVNAAQGGTFDQMYAFYDEIRFMQILPYQQAEPAAVGDLQRLAEDRQNVHTKEVSRQTEKLTNLLLKEKVSPEQRTLQMLTIKFAKFCKTDKMSQLIQVLDDMNLWYEKPTCIREGDALYRHLLNAAVCKIEASPLRKSLYRRAYEECTESVGLCCQGHLSRIINIFSGFESEFTSPVSSKELLQTKMAAISAMDSSHEDKVRHASDTLGELDIPKEEWGVWIDAL